MGKVVARDYASQGPKPLEAQLLLFVAQPLLLLHARPSRECGALPSRVVDGSAGRVCFPS